MIDHKKADAFHDHLDACEQCRENPFDLCEVGKPLLIACGEPAAPCTGPCCIWERRPDGSDAP